METKKENITVDRRESNGNERLVGKIL